MLPWQVGTVPLHMPLLSHWRVDLRGWKPRLHWYSMKSPTWNWLCSVSRTPLTIVASGIGHCITANIHTIIVATYEAFFSCFYLISTHKLWSGLQIRSVKLTSIDSTCVISSPNPMFDHLLESSWWDDSNKWSNIGFGEELCILENKKRSLSGALAVMLIIL